MEKRNKNSKPSIYDFLNDSHEYSNEWNPHTIVIYHQYILTLLYTLIYPLLSC